MSEIPYGSESYRKRNPHLFSPVGGLVQSERERGKRCQGEDKRVGEVQEGVGFRITLISMRPRLVDGHDNLRTGLKPLVDRITEWIGFESDSDKRLEWNYEQFRTNGRTGTIVHIERTRL